MTNISRIKFFPFYILSILPMFLLYFFSDLVSLSLYYLIKYRRQVVYKNLRNSFPAKSESEIKIIEKTFYRHFCDTMVESLKTLTISKRSVRKRFHVKNPELLKKFYDNNQHLVMYTAHQGNWEWLEFLPLFIPYQLNSFYRPLSNKYFDELMKIGRERFGAICVESDKGYRAFLKFAEDNILSLNAVIGDQRPGGGSSMHWTQFLNQDTGFLIGADRIARKSNQSVVFPHQRKRKRGVYEVEFKIIMDNVQEATESEIIDKYAGLLEEAINESPSYWLWSHNRWKFSRQDY